MKAVSAHVVSCCVYVKPIKNYAAHAWHHSIHVLQLGRSSCSSPSTKEIHSYGRDCTNVSIDIGKSQKALQLIVLTTCNVVPFCAARFFVRQKRFRLATGFPNRNNHTAAASSDERLSWVIFDLFFCKSVIFSCKHFSTFGESVEDLICLFNLLVILKLLTDIFTLSCLSSNVDLFLRLVFKRNKIISNK